MVDSADTKLVTVPPTGDEQEHPPEPAGGGELPDEGREMTLMEHMVELRDRLVKAVLGLAVATVAGFALTRNVIEILIQPLPERVAGQAKLLALNPTDTILLYFKVSLVIGVVLAMPIILYQLLQFVLPGLYPHERRYLYWLLPAGTIAFAVGATFSALVIIPFSIHYLSGFMAELAAPTYQIQSYFDFVTALMFWIGVVFEMPLVIYFLAKLGVINHKKLSGARKYAIVIAAVAAAVITPTPDPVTMMLVMAPLVLLYELGIILARLA
ncbi:MAG: twin-arginine translocase subunit TatC [Anaerolineae bacterium]